MMIEKPSLTKLIPARLKTVVFDWIKKDFCAYSEMFRSARAKSKDKLNKCFWCSKDFVDGEMIALGSHSSAGNKVLCQHCATEALEGKNHDR
jgi:hypothetical protein